MQASRMHAQLAFRLLPGSLDLYVCFILSLSLSVQIFLRFVASGARPLASSSMTEFMLHACMDHPFTS